ncbi:M24 family metallopeptidase [Candidatus Woesearchaeota archaeon]|nr:M24 family metallopeptidase [Candidatus Woesearchaeota archaeon]
MKLEKTRKACELTDIIFSELIKKLKNKQFKTEKDIVKFLEDQYKKHNVKKAFKPIVASKESSADPHYMKYNSELKKGFLMIDFGVIYKGFCSDMTRMFYIGEPKQQHIKLYNDIKEVHENTIKAIKPNMNIDSLCKKFRELLNKKDPDYIKHLKHSLGHGLGKKVHQKPKITLYGKGRLKPGMVFTIEPGLYWENKYGIRIEDDIYMNEKGYEVLTKSSRNLIILS